MKVSNVRQVPVSLGESIEPSLQSKQIAHRNTGATQKTPADCYFEPTEAPGCFPLDLPGKQRVLGLLPQSEVQFATEGLKKAYAATFAIQTASGTLGSGVNVAAVRMEDGKYLNFILTNRHVVEEEKGEFAVQTLVTSVAKGDIYRGKFGVTLPEGQQDVAIITVETKKPLPTIPIANSRSIAFGERVFAIGNPMGLFGSVTAGVISNPNRDFGEGRVLQFDAPISPGNSGGPLITRDGMLIGINTFMIHVPGVPTQNLNFAYPADEAILALMKRVQEYQNQPRMRAEPVS